MRAPELEIDLVDQVADRLRVTQDALLRILDISARSFRRRRVSHGLLSSTESDRLLRLARMARAAEATFGNADKACRWLCSDHVLLGAKPITLLGTDAGAHDVWEELVRIEYCNFA